MPSELNLSVADGAIGTYRVTGQDVELVMFVELTQTDLEEIVQKALKTAKIYRDLADDPELPVMGFIQPS